MGDIALAIDTSGSFCSIALKGADGAVTTGASSGEGDHFERLPGLVDEIFASAGLSMSALSAIRIGIGPGSFTGLRIGLSFAKGMAAALRIPLYGVCSFEAAGREVLAHQPGVSAVAVVSDARRDEVFVGAYARGATGEVVTVEAPRIVPISELSTSPWITQQVWLSPLRDFAPAGLHVESCPTLGRGLLLAPVAIGSYSLSEIATLEPSYLRAVAAKTIEERKQKA